MARITTYALDSNISLNDKLVGTDADDNSITKNYSIDTLGDGLISLKNIITGGGTLNTIPLFTPDGKRIGDSIITQNALGTTIAVNGIFTVYNSAFMNGALTVEGASAFNDEAVFWNQTVFEEDANFQGSISDSGATPGTPGQVLSSTGSEVRWVDNNVLTSPGGIQFRIVVDEAGNLSTTPL